MQRLLLNLLICLVILAGSALALEGVEGPADCARCGMNRVFFAYSRAWVSYRDGSSTATCSIHCAVEDVLKSGKEPASLRVADYRGKELIDAASATWVVGGKVRGVMTAPAKWAFARREKALEFVKAEGGSVTPYPQVLRLLKEEVAEMDKPAEME